MVAEQESVIGGGVLSTAEVLDLTVDAHVHTGFAAGRDSVGVVVSAADRAGLTSVTFADQAGPETTWLAAYADAVRRARPRTAMTLRVAAEVEVVRPDGWLALPAGPGSPGSPVGRGLPPAAGRRPDRRPRGACPARRR